LHDEPRLFLNALTVLLQLLTPFTWAPFTS
jgi:hypothetical protein